MRWALTTLPKCHLLHEVYMIPPQCKNWLLLSFVLPRWTFLAVSLQSWATCIVTLSLQIEYRTAPSKVAHSRLSTNILNGNNKIIEIPLKACLPGEKHPMWASRISYQDQVINKLYDSSGFVYQVSPLHSASLIKKMNSILALCPPESSLPGRGVNVVNCLPSC